MIIKISFGVSFIEYFKFVSEVSKGTVIVLTLSKSKSSTLESS